MNENTTEPKVPDHTDLPMMITHWMNATERMKTQFGVLTCLEWCHLDAARMDSGGGMSNYVATTNSPNGDQKVCITRCSPAEFDRYQCELSLQA
jgi:hypothetical protein